MMTVTSHALFLRRIGASRGWCCCCCVVLLLAMLLKVESTFLSCQGVRGVRVFPSIHWLVECVLEIHLIVSNTCF